MYNLEEKIKNTIKKCKLIESGDKLVLAVSGGPDSITMLDILNKISQEEFKNCQKAPSPMAKNCQKAPSPMANFQIVVTHVNHMIRKEAKQDEEYVKEYCEKNKIEFYAKSIDVRKIANNNKIGTEEAGRIERYKFFDEVMQKTGSNKIAIAHNKNDNAETIIMNLLRGSGMVRTKGN